MVCKTIWTCDGCGDDRVVSDASGTGNWNRVTVTTSGFKGYPVGELGNQGRSFELCPRCQSHLNDVVNPKSWPREAKAVAAKS